MAFGAFGQNQANDIIYPVKNEAVVFDCRILAVVEGNLVQYSIGGKEMQKRASAVRKQGVYMDLSAFLKANLKKEGQEAEKEFFAGMTYDTLTQEQKIEEYNAIYENSLAWKRRGGALGVLGVACIGASFIVGGETTSWGLANSLFLFGFSSFSIGVPIWLINKQIVKNNLEALETIGAKKVALSLSATPNGLGFVLRF